VKASLLFVGLALGMLDFARVFAAPNDVALGWRVPLEPRTKTVEEAEAAFARVMEGLPGMAGAKPQATVVKGGEFVLWGDLFRTGGCFALTELSPQQSESGPAGFLFAEWTGHVWEPRQLWEIPLTWRPAGWKSSGDDYLPAAPASEPFILRDYNDDGHPEVIVAGEVDKYYQADYLLRFDPKSRGLVSLGCSYGPPVRRGPYVIFYSNSGRRAIYDDWDFCQWRGNELVTVASWHEEVPYNNIDPSFCEATLPRPDGTDEVIRVSETDLQSEFSFPVLPASEWESVYLVTTARQPFGMLRIMWKPWEWTARLSNGSIWTTEQTWLFERLTGLPRRLYPSGREGWEPVERLEKLATMKFDGDPAWAGQLSVPAHGK